MDAGVVSLDGLLAAAAARWPDRPALESPSGRWTYAELDAAVSAAAAGLHAAGARQGDDVAFALGHDAPLYAAPFACDRARVTGLLLSTALPAAAWARQLASVRPSLLVADDAHSARLQAAASGAPVASVRVALPLEADGARPATPTAAPEPDRAVALLGTSGTTGQPTVVRLTSRGLLHVGRAYLDLLDLGPDERSLVVMPLTHIGALSTQTLTMPMVGGCNVLPADTRAQRCLPRMVEHRITLLDAAPAWLTVLARQPPIPVPSWRTLVYGGAPMPAATVQAIATAHPTVAMFDVWGLSEAHGPVTAQRYDRDRPPPAGTVGRPVAGLGVRAGGPAGPLPPEVVGELWVCGPTVHAGTLDDPDPVPPGGWLPTGDLGAVAADGTVRLIDRKKAVIVRGGVNISSREVEQVLCSAAGVTEAAVVAVADGLGDQAVGAAVAVGGGARVSVGDLRRLVTEQVGRHATPRRIARVSALPRTATGKVDVQAVRALL